MEYKPAKNCVICSKSQSDAGSMIISQKLRGIGISKRYLGGGSDETIFISLPLNDEKSKYIVFWGEVGFWSVGVMERARNQFLNGEYPWFCSYCGKRVCSKCGMPLVYPVGSDYLSSNGKIYHSPILPSKVPCINKLCSNSRTKQKC